ncbi:uncharacterized protein AMSG_00538 [Thecamonas trahens ATCC 50062]|uniref:Vacuolar ATPase assembly protein VMA22 n=1 Tax=Thecamonas trahens ATCC 50062 TaxID=461836 RepID=A0A0L0D9L7_THETB|nr:hypothetical protein AMSG_00538 [Thecamonas trahens ATCC 50062]KNC48761.1 hypothetical protein AMSG_00538 [Thecamonas trahens ATCC 50062]|eukprot:XP_013762812.1 hypothetical protein AMSG_00538 [Thecamonas trahens ATCC 50062]
MAMDTNTERRLLRVADHVALGLLESWERYLEAQGEVEASVRSGFVSLAKARFDGKTLSGGIGADGWDEAGMRALVRVVVTEDASSSSIDDNINNNSSRTNVTDIASTPSPSGLSRRIARNGHLIPHLDAMADPHFDVTTWLAEIDQQLAYLPARLPPGAKIRDEDSDEVIKVKDPLRWYGIMVPSSLRTAQSRFVAALDAALLAAAAWSKIVVLAHTYAALDKVLCLNGVPDAAASDPAASDPTATDPASPDAAASDPAAPDAARPAPASDPSSA